MRRQLLCWSRLGCRCIDDDAFTTLTKICAHDDVSGGTAQIIGPIAVVSPDQMNSPSLLTPVQAFRWFIEYGGRYGNHWQNLATRVPPETKVPCHPLITAPYLTMPVQMLVGRNDEMVHCNPELQDVVFHRISGKKERVEIERGYFGLL